MPFERTVDVDNSEEVGKRIMKILVDNKADFPKSFVKDIAEGKLVLVKLTLDYMRDIHIGRENDPILQR